MNHKKLFSALVFAFSGFAAFATGESVMPYPNFGLSRVDEMMFLGLQLGVIISPRDSAARWRRW